MKSLVLFLLIVLVSFSFSQEPYMRTKFVNRVDITGNATDSIYVSPMNSVERRNMESTFTGSLGLIINCRDLGGTAGSVAISYTLSTWDSARSAIDVVALTAAQAWTDNEVFVFDISQNFPVWGVWVYFTRSGATGMGRFNVWQTYVKYR